MTPIERLKNASKKEYFVEVSRYDLLELLAAYDARGEEIEEWRNKAGVAVCDDDGKAIRWGAISQHGHVAIRSCSATDSAVAKVEGGKA